MIIKPVLSRLSAQFLKPTLAILATLAVGGAWADITWTGQGGDSKWETAENWSAYDTTTGMTLDHSGVSGAYEINISSNPTRAGYIWVAANNGVTLKASGTYGLNQTAGDIRVGTWNNGKLTIDGGTHAINSLVVASGWWNNFAPTGELNVKGGAVVTAGWNALGDTDSDTTKSTHNPNSAGTLNVENATLSFTSDFLVGRLAYGTLNVNNGAIVTCQGGDSSARWTIVGEQATGNGTINLNYGGVLAVWHIQKGGGSATVNFNGGTLKTLGNAGNCEYIIGNDGAPATGPTVNISANGGVFDSNGLDTKVGVAVTGAGTITKKGTGTLTFTGDMSGFVGRVAVASGAGSVTLPATASRARAGDYTSVVENQDGTFTFAYDANGSAAGTATVEILNLDFEDEATYNAGWSSSGNGGVTYGTRTTVQLDGENNYIESHFLRVHSDGGMQPGPRRHQVSYTLPAIVSSLTEYTISFDWFAARSPYDAGDSSRDAGFSLKSENSTIIKVVSNSGVDDNIASVYLDGAATAEATTIPTAPAKINSNDPSQDCTGTTNQDKWYRVVVRANAQDGVTLEILQNDFSTIAFTKTRVCDYINPTSLYLDLNKIRTNFPECSGFDNVLIVTPAVAAVDGINYKTFAEAVAAATSTSTITLCRDVELATSVELPYGATLNLNGNILYTTDPDVAVTFDDDVHYLESVTAGGVKTFSETVTLPDTVYVWTGNGDGTSWSNSGNWSLAGSAAVPSGETAEVFIPANATSTINLDFAEDLSVKEIKVDGNVSFTSSGGKYLYAETVSGKGALTLQGTYFRAFDGKNLYFEQDLNLVIADGYTATFRTEYSNSERYIYFRGKLTGAGTIKLDQQNKQNSCGGAFEGDATQFGGEVVAYNHNSSGPRERTYFKNGNATSASASYEVYGSGDKSDMFRTDNDTYHLGALNGSVGYQLSSGYRNGCTIVVGERNEDCSFGGCLSRGQNNNTWYANSLKKEGTKKLTITGSGIANIEIANGVLDIAAESALPMTRADGDYNYYTIKFTGGTLVTTQDPSKYIRSCTTHAICFSNAVNDVNTWETKLENSNTAGLTKKGEGTLTLSQPPAYTGTTKVEDGVLYVINGEYSLTLDASTAEVTTDKDGYRKFVPASVAIATPTVMWGDDFAKVTVSAAVTSNYGEGGLTYNLKIGGNVVDGAVGTVNNGVVTFSDVDISGLNLSRYGDVSVEVTASSGGSQAATSGSKNVMFADEQDWVDENYETTTTAAAGGAWQTAVSYDGETHKAAVVDNRFSATNCTTGDVVTVAISDVVYTMLSDTSEVDADAQGAVALSTNVVNDVVSTNFFVLTRSNDVVSWTAADGVAGNTNVAYDIELTFDYVNGKYSVSINGTALTIGGVAAFDIVKTANQFVKDIDFLGAGSLAAVNGVQYEGKMAIDQNGVKYNTVAAALDANKGVKGAVVKLLHASATTSADGWNFDSATHSFIKMAVGVMLLVF